MKIEDQVRKFHKEFNLPINDEIGFLDSSIHFNRVGLIQEELSEYSRALAMGDIKKVADALGDLIYVVVGGFIEHGLPVETVMDIIQESNMSKIGGYIDEGGKYIKPRNYTKPDWSFLDGI